MGAGKDAQDRYKRLFLLKGDSVIYHYSEYPSVKGIQKKDLALLYCFQGQYDVAPEGNKFVVVTSLGAIMEIFSVQGDSIHLEKAKGFTKPIFEVHGNQIYPLPETIWGFHDVYATGRYIYTLFSNNKEGMKGPAHIAVFDWQGNLIQLYRTGYHLSCLCADELNKEIYAVGIANNYETVLLKFPLPNL